MRVDESPKFALVTFDDQHTWVTYVDSGGTLRHFHSPKSGTVTEAITAIVRTKVPEANSLIVVGDELSEDGRVVTIGSSNLNIADIQQALNAQRVIIGTKKPAAKSMCACVPGLPGEFWLNKRSNELDLPIWVVAIESLRVTLA